MRDPARLWKQFIISVIYAPHIDFELGYRKIYKECDFVSCWHFSFLLKIIVIFDIIHGHLAIRFTKKNKCFAMIAENVINSWYTVTLKYTK